MRKFDGRLLYSFSRNEVLEMYSILLDNDSEDFIVEFLPDKKYIKGDCKGCHTYLCVSKQVNDI